MAFIYETSSKEDGNMSFAWGAREDVLKNRNKFLSKHGIDPENCVAMRVDDKDVVLEVLDSKNNEVYADALITAVPNIFLMLVTGDCLPIVCHDPVHGAIGLGHGSRMSTDKKLARKIIDAMTEKFESKPQDMRVFIGPGARKESYRLKDPEQKKSAEWRQFLEELPDGETGVDMAGYNVEQLLDAGLSRANIQVSPIDTISSSDFFSHYRSVKTGEAEARFVSIVGIRNG
jgi:hypothetical protein